MKVYKCIDKFSVNETSKYLFTQGLLGKLSKKKAEQKVKTAFRVGGYLTFFTFLKHSNKVKKFQEGGV